MKLLREPKSFWSNFFFLIPLYFAVMGGYTEISVIIVLLIISSGLYHLIKNPGYHWWWEVEKIGIEDELLYLDTLVAVLLGLANLFLFWEKGLPTLFYIALILVALSFVPYFRRENYDTNHALWHLGTVAITVLALIA